MDNVKVAKVKKTIPTYIPKRPNELPMFFENKPYQGASGRLYPIPYSDGLTDEKKDVEYDVFEIENEYIKTEVLPAIGGKILSGYDKVGNYDFIYRNRVIKPALVGLAGAWISGGIEFNWPQHHRPTTFLPLEATIEENDDGSKTVWTGEVEPLNRMKGMAGITIDPGRSYIKAKIKLYNRTALPQIFMWWANVAVSVNNKYRTIFPPDVEWVNDHDRRAIMSWPIAKGIYNTARPYNYGEGTDLSRYESVIVPSSFLISQGQSDMDFVAGYDEGLQKGIVTVANHHIAPGKKMWTWGHGEFGEMWCSNLTDEDGPYIELMTGVYTDNQPDFTWIAPYESREFEQYWYPVRDLGYVKNATIDAAMNMEQRGDSVFFGFNVTGKFDGAVITVKDGDEVIFQETKDLTPEEAYLNTVALNGHKYEDITVSLCSKEGKELVSYKEYIRGQKQPIEVRNPVVRPEEIETVEELFINGYHLEQYKQHNYDARDYYLEGLRRDPGDIRCNTAMGRIALKNGDFEACISYCNKAIERLTSRNQHPTDTEAIYLKGIALVYLGRDKEAYDTLYRAAWNYTHRGAALYRLALLDCKNGDFNAALLKLDESYGLNKGHNNALCLKSAILRKLGKVQDAEAVITEAIAYDRLDMWARVEKNFISGGEEEYIKATFADKAENFINVAVDYMDAGFMEDALKVLNMSGEDPMVLYYMSYISDNLGYTESADVFAARAAALDTGVCFPSRLSDIAVLQYAIKKYNTDANVCYYLGSLFYDRFRYDEAIELWEEAIRRDPRHAKTLRNLALGYFDKRGDKRSAKICMEKAMEYRRDPRLLFEYQQLLKNMNVPPADRLAVYDAYPDLLRERDDCYLDRIVILCELGRYKEAIDAAKIKHFHIYEGGEGNLTKQHAWMHVLYANELAAQGNNAEAEKYYHDGVNMPKSYGEAKTFFNQESHLYYFLGCLLESEGRMEEAEKAFREATVYKATVSELSLFRALAMQKLMNFSEAEAVLYEMIEAGEKLINDCDLRTYYGVGSPTPMPFENDIIKKNTVQGAIFKAFAFLGLGKRELAEEAMNMARSQDPYNFSVYAFDQIKDRI